MSERLRTVEPQREPDVLSVLDALDRMSDDRIEIVKSYADGVLNCRELRRNIGTQSLVSKLKEPEAILNAGTPLSQFDCYRLLEENGRNGYPDTSQREF